VRINTSRDLFFGLRAELSVCFFLGLLVLAIYWQVTNHSFVNWDDPAYVTKNLHIKDGFSRDSILWSFTSLHAVNWHPLTWLSHIVDVQLFGMNAGRHHLVNVCFHLINTLLLFVVLRRMTDALWKSVFVAVLFAMHPLHVESVAWVSERKDVLSTFFWMLTMWAYVRYTELPGANRYLLVVLFFALGLMAKPMLVTLPFVLFLLDYWPLKRFQFGQSGGGRLVLEKLPLIALSAACSVVIYIAQQSGGAVVSLSLHPLTVRTANALISYIAYIGKTVWPFHLAVFYPYPHSFSWWQVAGAFLSLVSVSLLVIRSVKRRPYLAIGWLWYMGTLVPVIGLVQVGSQAIADRYTYIPLIGLFIVIAWGIPELLARWRHKKTGLIIIAASLVFLLTANTHNQIGYWADSVSLFEHTLDVTVNNGIIHNNLGMALAKQGKTADAIAHYHEALNIDPFHARAHNNLASALYDLGRTEEAIHHYSQALKIIPTYAEAHNNLGFVLFMKGRTPEAVHHYTEALRINPELTAAHNNLGHILANQGRTGEAIGHFSKVLHIDPRNAIAHNNLGLMLENEGKSTDAVRHYSEAIRINPGCADAHKNLANILAKQGRTTEAIRHYYEMLRTNPGHAEAHTNLGLLLISKEEFNEASTHFIEALKTNPKHVEAHNGLGVALANQDKIVEAINHFSEALRSDPNHAEARHNLNKALGLQGK